MNHLLWFKLHHFVIAKKLIDSLTGFRNTHSQISASLASNGKYVISASEDSFVYVWRHEVESQPNRSKGVSVTQSYELFHCLDVSVAIPWPGMSDQSDVQHSCSGGQNGTVYRFEEDVIANHPTTLVEEANGSESSPLASDRSSSPFSGTPSCATNNHVIDRISRTWSEEKLFTATKNHSPRVSVDYSNGFCQNRSAVGMVIVTAGLRGEIRTFQNFGLPVRI